MLLGDFSEAKKDVIALDYKGCVLKAIVEYVVTDSAEILNEAKNEIVSTEDCQDLICLMDAAIYFELPGLCEKAFDRISQALRKQPSLSFSVLEICQGAVMAGTDQLKNMTIICLGSNMAAVDENCVSLLSVASLEEILKSNNIPTGEFSLFELIVKWFKAKTNQVQNENGAPPNDHLMAMASRLVKENIRLDQIDPGLLSTAVKSSGLVSADCLLGAYERQALETQKQYNIVFKKTRVSVMEAAVWENTATDLTIQGRDLLRYPKITGGKLEWTLEVVRKNRYTWAGIALLNSFKKSESLTDQPGGWAYRADGEAMHNHTIYSAAHPEFSEGSKITFTLNLLPHAAGNGTLSASVDGGDPFLLFQDLWDSLVGHNDGFVPAVSTSIDRSFRILHIRKLTE